MTLAEPVTERLAIPLALAFAVLGAWLLSRISRRLD